MQITFKNNLLLLALICSLAIYVSPTKLGFTTQNSGTPYGCVTVFQHCQFKGKSKTICDRGVMDLKEFNGQISSFKVGRAAKILLFSGRYFKGGRKTFTKSDSCLVNDGWNDKARSLKVIKIVRVRTSYKPKYGCVIIYQHCNYKGRSRTVCDRGLRNLGVFEKVISSVKVGPGASITLYTNKNFRGNSKRFTKSDSCLVNDGWNDVSKSLKVIKKVTHGVPQNPYPGCVIFYEHCYYKGKAKMLCGNSYKPYLGRYSKKISSLKVSSGTKAILYSGKLYKGRQKSFVSSGDSCLVNDGWNDVAKSLKVLK